MPDVTAASPGSPASPSEPESAALEARELRACLRNLISLLSLPAMWTGQEPEAVLEVLVDALASVLRLDLVYGRIDPAGTRGPMACVLRAPGRADIDADAMEHALESQMSDGAMGPWVVSNPLGGAPLHVIRVPFGLTEEGHVVAASARANFPSEHEQTLLRVATNQALIGLHGARLLKQHAVAEELERQRARAASLGAAVGEAFTQKGSLDHKLRRIAFAVVQHLGAALAELWTYDERERMLELRANAGPSAHADRAPRRIPLGAFLIGRIAKEQKRLVTNAVATAPHIADSEWARREGMVAFAGFPLLLQDRLVGVAALFSREPLSESTVEALAAIADEISLGIDRERADDEREGLLEAAQRHVELLRGLADAAVAINSSATLDEVLQTITDRARELVGAHQANTSMTAGPDWSQAIKAVSLSDKYAPYRTYDVKPDGSEIRSLVCRFNKSMRMTQAELEAHPAWRGFGNENGRHPSMRGWLASPLVSRTGQNIGCIQLSDKYEGDFTEHDEVILGQLAQFAAVTIENAQFQRETQRARELAEQEARRTSQLQQVTAALTGAMSRQDVAAVAVGTAREVLLASTAVVYLAADVNAVELVAHHGLAPVIERWPRLPLDAPLPLATAIRTGEPVWIHSHDALLASYPAVAQGEGMAGQLQAVAALPLAAHGRVLGGIAFSFAEGRGFAHSERELLSTMAQQFAQAVERANLFEAERTAREERERVVAELRQTVYYNEIFAGILAHDLRNPLGAIITAADLMLRRQEGDKLTKPINRILSSGERMTRMIEQLLDFTQIRVGGGIEIVRRDTDLADVCRQVLNELEDANPAWEMKIEVRGDVVGNWDNDRLLQVVSNLAGNAVTHGDPEAGLLLKLDGTGDHVEFRMSNKGAIPVDLIPTLFDPFRGIKQRRHGPRGLGLGLYITKQLVLAHGGSVDVESNPETGTTFIVRLPRDTAPAHSNSVEA